MSLRFVIIGFGYIAQRHLQAIKDTGNEVLAVYDPHNAAGLLDRYFPACRFFTSFEQFDGWCAAHRPDYATVLSPNYMHHPHVLWATRMGMKVICEKPLGLSVGEVQDMVGLPVSPILQLRYHPSTIKLMQQQWDKPEVHVEYHTPRGDWYHQSWKARPEQSGGLIMNIGVHLLDLLTYTFGPGQDRCRLHLRQRFAHTEMGELELLNARVHYHLSISMDRQPHRVFTVNGQEYEFDSGFTELHTRCYQEILAGRGFTPKDCLEAIRLVELIQHHRG